MSQQHHIRYLRRHEIDNARWDTCIQRSSNGLIYGRTFFLDKMTDGHWDALVLEDYQAVMPLIMRKKFGFMYLYQPFFMPALGIAGDPGPDVPTRMFLASIPPVFRLWDIDMNETNVIDTGKALPTLKVNFRMNYLLSLDPPYEAIREGYKRLAGRMLKKAEGLTVVRKVDPAEVIDRYRKTYKTSRLGISRQDYLRLADCAGSACSTGYGSAYLAQAQDGEVQAFYLVFADEHFVYSTLGGSTERGKDNGAFYLLTDAAIRDHAGVGKVFRFEGSDIPGIAFFNSQFGSTPIRYPRITLNKLPFPVNLFKRI